MKKTAAILLVCVMVLLAGISMAAQPDQKAVIMLEGFDDLTEADVNNVSGAVTEPDDHSAWGLGDGTAQLVKGDVRKGLAMVPDYESGYESFVLRSTYKRTGTEFGSAERIAAVKEAWKNSDGFRFYVKNNTDEDITLQVHTTINTPDLEDEFITLTAYKGIKLYNMDGEEEEVIFHEPEVWKNTRIIIPWGFEGWVDIPLTVAGVGGNSQDGEFGWFFPEAYHNEGKIEAYLQSEYLSLENIKAGVQLDFRFVPWDGILDEEEPGEYNIVVDSLQLYTDGEGEVTYLPDDGTPELPPEEEETPAPTSSPSATNTSGSEPERTTAAAPGTAGASASESASEPEPEQGDSTLLIIIIAAAVVVIAAGVIITIAVKKKKKPADKE